MRTPMKRASKQARASNQDPYGPSLWSVRDLVSKLFAGAFSWQPQISPAFFFFCIPSSGFEQCDDLVALFVY